MRTFNCPHCQKAVVVTKKIRGIVFSDFTSRPRPGGTIAVKGEMVRERCRKAGLAAMAKRWGYVPGTPRKRDLAALERAARKAARLAAGEDKNLEIGQAGVTNLMTEEKTN